MTTDTKHAPALITRDTHLIDAVREVPGLPFVTVHPDTLAAHNHWGGASVVMVGPDVLAEVARVRKLPARDLVIVTAAESAPLGTHHDWVGSVAAHTVRVVVLPEGAEQLRVLLGVSPAVPAFIDPAAPETCRHCGGHIEHVKSSWQVDQGTSRDPNGYSYAWFHVGADQRCPDDTISVTGGLIHPWAECIPRCPQCHSTTWHDVSDMYADRMRCDNCRHETRHSLGD